MQIIHYSVMKDEVLTHLVPFQENGAVVDCTLGEGGHAEAFLETYPELTVVGVDRDEELLKRAGERLEHYGSRFLGVHAWFDDFLSSYPGDFPRPQGILMDLGISMYHYEASNRGFSFLAEEALDMRLDVSQRLSARDVVNTYDERRLADIIYQYGEERYSRRIASAISRARHIRQITQAKELRDIVYFAVPAGYRRGRIHPATKTFQALRIAVNSELSRLSRGIDAAVSLLSEHGRIAVISFHSLEDRIVKHTFRRYAGKAPGDDPLLQQYSERPMLRLVTKKPLIPESEEVTQNPASRSAKLRVAQKLQEPQEGRYETD